MVKSLKPSELKERLQEKGNITIINGKIVAILGENLVKSIKIVGSENRDEMQKEVNGVFICLGGVPMSELVKKAGISVDKSGCIIVDRWQRTNIEGVFAAGDCTCGGMQVVTSAGEGAMAALKASVYIKKRKSEH